MCGCSLAYIIYCRVTEALSKSGFVVSPKSTLSPVTCIFFLGKGLDLTARTITLYPRAFFHMLAAWLRVAVRAAKHSCFKRKRSISQSLGALFAVGKPSLRR